MSKSQSVKLTLSKIEAMNIGDELWDTVVTGLHIRAGKRGKSILYFYRTLEGKKRRPKIGNYGALTLETARAIARIWAADVAAGKDPSLIRHKKRLDGPPATLQELYNKWHTELRKAQKRRKSALEQADAMGLASGQRRRFLKEKKKSLADLKPSTLETYELCWRRLFQEFGRGYEVNAITKDQVAAFHDQLGSSSTIMANRTLSFISSIMNRAVGWKMRDKNLSNPAQGVAKFKEYDRERYLMPDEAPRFLKTAQKWMYSKNRQHRAIARLAWLCLFNGARRSEFMKSRLSWIDWDRGVLRLPDSKTGAKDIVLSAESLQVLVQRYEEWEENGAIPEYDWIIPGLRRSMHLTTPKNGWKSFLEDAGIANLRLHDLRHSFASVGLSGGAGGLDQMGQILGHADPKTTLRYAHLMQSSSRAVVDQTGEHLKNMMEGNHSYQNAIIPKSVEIYRNTLINSQRFL